MLQNLNLRACTPKLEHRDVPTLHVLPPVEVLEAQKPPTASGPPSRRLAEQLFEFPPILVPTGTYYRTILFLPGNQLILPGNQLILPACQSR